MAIHTSTGGRERLRVRAPFLAALTGLAVAATSVPVSAQTLSPASVPPGASQSHPPPAEDDALSEVVVTGRRPPPQPGAVIGDIKPELQLSPSDIQSYGVSTVTELLDELAPQTRSDRGRGGEGPVVLLNGRRISGFNEIRDIPTEAILRVDILPEEVSLKYGYSANQRVVNIVLRRRFRAVTGEGRLGAPTEGGQASGQAEADLLHIRGDNRLNLDLKYQESSNLTEADRDIVSPGAASGAGEGAVSGDAVDDGRDRTLLPATRSLSANGVLSRALGSRTSATVNATLGATTSDTLQGLPGIDLTVPAGDPFSQSASDAALSRTPAGLGPLRQSVDGWTAHLGSTVNRDAGSWRLSLTDAYDHADTWTRSDAGVDAGPLQALLTAGSASLDPYGPLPAALLMRLPQDKAHAVSDTANVQALANGPLLNAPAGPLYASVKIGDTQSWLDSTSNRADLFHATELSRNDFNAQLNLDLPLTGGKRHVLDWLGDLSVNLNGAVDQLSDFGLLHTIGYGANWSPFEGVSLIVSRTNDQAAPTVQQLGGPVVLTPGSRILDFATGRTVDVTRVDGANAALIADDRTVTKVGLTMKPFSGQNLTISANYIDSRIKNPIVTFPAATAQIEAAFPDRFTRDADGELVQVDDRPVNFAEQDRRELRWGFDYSRPLGPQPKPRERRRFRDQAAGDGPPGEGPPRPPSDADRADPNRPSADRGDGPPPDAGGRRGGADGEGRGGGRGGFGGGGFGGGLGGGRGGGGPGGGPGGGRLQLAIYHTVLFEDRMLVRPGGPVLDLLNGSAASSTGGAPRQEIEAQAGFTLNGIGARLSADWKSGTFVRGAPASPTGDLTFSDLATVNLRLFDNLGQQPTVVRRWPWLRGSRVTLSLTNLFDARITVRDAQGSTPLSYQSAYLDPAGRTLTLSLRKLWF